MLKICPNLTKLSQPCKSYQRLLPSHIMDYVDFSAHVKDHISDPLYQAMAIIGGFIVLYGLVSLLIKERLYLSETFMATSFGIIFGPVALNIINLSNWVHSGNDLSRFMIEFSRIVISVQVMAVAVSLPQSYFAINMKSMIIMLGPVMLIMWIISTLGVWLIVSVPFTQAMIIGACITPTDPILAHSVIKGKFANKYIPVNLRNLLSAESGANDGLAFPLMMLPIYLIVFDYNVSATLINWTLITWMYEICLSILIGFVCGFSARFLLQQSERRKWIDKESFLVFAIALAVFIAGLVSLIASDDLLAVFIAGNAFTWDDWFMKSTKEAHLQEVIDMLFNITYFIFFGSIIPWNKFKLFGYVKLTGLGVFILCFRRLPIVYALRSFIPALKSKREAFFAGFFGPIGVGAIFFSLVADSKLRMYHKLDGTLADLSDNIFTVVCFMVLSSVLVHGVTVPITNFHLKKRKHLLPTKGDASDVESTFSSSDINLKEVSENRRVMMNDLESAATLDLLQDTTNK